MKKTSHIAHAFWALTLGLASTCSIGQCEQELPREKKAQRLFEKASDSKSRASLFERIVWLEEALEWHPDDPELHMMAAELNYRRTSAHPSGWTSMSVHLDALNELCPEGWPETKFLHGALAYVREDYDGAVEHFQSYLDQPESNTRRSRRREVKQLLPELVFLQQYNAHADRPAPVPLSEVSQREDEYLPMISPDGKLLFFTRTFVEKDFWDVTSTRKELFSWSKRTGDDSPFDAGVPLTKPFNAGSNCGGASISTDNKLMVLAADRPVPGNPDNVDLFMTEYHVDHRDGDGIPVYTWSPLMPLDATINTQSGWESQPAISGDGSTLFFASARAESTPDLNGNPTMDIFLSKRTAQGTWGPPERLPSPINSEAQDKAPFLHPDGRTLYFSSNRQPGGGGYDLWMSQTDSTGRWMDAVNLGLPLNSSGDEHGLVVSTDGKFGMFASRRDGTLGLDICTYSLPDELKPDPVTVVTGEVGWPLPKGELTLNIEYVQSKRVEQIQISTEDGTFAHVVKLEDGENVVMTLEGDEIGYQSRVVHQDGTDPGNSVSLDFVPENPNGDGDAAFELPDVQFDTKKATLSSRSLVVLSALANHMARNPNRVLHIEGHTDNVGDAEDNLQLSQARAEAVQDHLISQGIAADRLRVRGFGETAPKTTNATPEGRKVNRRTAFRWTE